uniref:Uncharacterized protein n=1 Tax=Laticauda laticaudata TaxID=8630 RepID=A0A8C5RKA3_LATLA
MTGNLHRYVTIPDFILPTAVTIILMAVANKLEIVHVAFTVFDGIFYHIYSHNSNKTKIMLRDFALLLFHIILLFFLMREESIIIQYVK